MVGSGLGIGEVHPAEGRRRVQVGEHEQRDPERVAPGLVLTSRTGFPRKVNTCVTCLPNCLLSTAAASAFNGTRSCLAVLRRIGMNPDRRFATRVLQLRHDRVDKRNLRSALQVGCPERQAVRRLTASKIPMPAISDSTKASVFASPSRSDANAGPG